jgi:hypothetical protein
MRPTGYKSHDQVLAELKSADSTDEWVLEEVADFLGFAGDLEEKRRQSRELLARDVSRVSIFKDVASAHHTTLAYELTRSRPGTGDVALVYATAPSAPALLYQCATMCEIGDRVTLRHLRALGASVEVSATWPFSLFDATVMTSPHPEELETEPVTKPSPAPLSKLLRRLTNRRD